MCGCGCKDTTDLSKICEVKTIAERTEAVNKLLQSEDENWTLLEVKTVESSSPKENGEYRRAWTYYTLGRVK